MNEDDTDRDVDTDAIDIPGDEVDERPRRRGMTPKGIAIAVFAGLLVGVAVFSIFFIVINSGGGGHAQVASIPTAAYTPPDEVAASGAFAVDHDEVDLGDVPLGQTVNPEFVVTNSADTPLVIRDVRVKVVEGCCPPEPEVAANEVPAGGNTTISMPMMMHENMGGPHLFELTVYTSDPAHSEYVLQVKANFV